MRSGSNLPIIIGGGGAGVVLNATVYDKRDIQIKLAIVYR